MNSPDGGIIIRCEQAAFGYGGTPVLGDVSCELRRGRITGLVGPNGSGKTTFLKTVLGLLAPLGGSVRSFGRLRFAYVPQAETLAPFWPLSVRQLVALPARAGFFGTARRAGPVEEALRRVGLLSIAGRRFSELSGGQRQKALLAQAIAQAPQVLVLDEPTRGLDVAAERDLLSLLVDLREREGMTALLVAHGLQVPLSVADDILLFKEGRVRQTSASELMHTRLLEELYGIDFLRFEQGGARWAGARL